MTKQISQIKAVLVGDSFIGKRTLIGCCSDKGEPIQWIYENTAQIICQVYTNVSILPPWESKVQNKSKPATESIKVQLSLWPLLPIIDDDMPRVRDRILQDAHVIGLCYKITEKESLEHAVHKVCL